MKNEASSWKIPQSLLSVLKPVLLLVSVIFLVLIGRMFYGEYQWNAIAQRSLSGETKKMLPDYARLYKTMKRNGLFLYNYGAELNFVDEFSKSTTLLNECSKFFNDIDLQLILADNHTQLKQYYEAEKCLKLAHQMVPNRFTPLYRLVILYKKMGKDTQAYQLAKIIIKKPIKVISSDVMNVKAEMKKMVENLK